MSKAKLPSFENDFTSWYQEVIARAELAEHSPVKGCMTIRPYGYEIWENIREELNTQIKRHGVKNASFPMFIPESYLSREKDHVEGFSPEIAVVTYAGGDTLQENLVVRPTSETIIHESMSRWIQSYRDLPLRLNQWCNVVRWEKHPRLFLRTTEFQWQEGHTAHATEEEARQEVAEMVQIYHDFSASVLAIPTIMGRKSEKEKFAGAIESYSIEGLMPDGKALQMGTVHYLGENFSKMANVNYLDKDGLLKLVQMTSWGVSTRLIGALIMVHGDNMGLVLPPKVAPIQVVIVPISESFQDYAYDIKSELEKSGIRVEVDNRKGVRPGAKFYEHEIRGVPIRLTIGEKEVSDNTISFALRFNSSKGYFHKDTAIEKVSEILVAIQKDMYEAANEKLLKHILHADNKNHFYDLLSNQSGMIVANWCNETDCELSIKESTSAVSRNMPLHKQHDMNGNCIWCGKPAKSVAYFAKAY